MSISRTFFTSRLIVNSFTSCQVCQEDRLDITCPVALPSDAMSARSPSILCSMLKEMFRVNYCNCVNVSRWLPLTLDLLVPFICNGQTSSPLTSDNLGDLESRETSNKFCTKTFDEMIDKKNNDRETDDILIEQNNYVVGARVVKGQAGRTECGPKITPNKRKQFAISREDQHWPIPPGPQKCSICVCLRT